MRNNSAPPKWSKLWTDIPRPGDHIGAYTTEELEQMNQEFTAAVERALFGRRERDGGGRNIRLETPMKAMAVSAKNRIMTETSELKCRYRVGGKMIPHREVRQGRLGVTEILSDLLLFSCSAAFIVGIVVAAASLLS